MTYEMIVQLTTQALMLCVVLSLPAVAVSALVGLLVSFAQAVTSLQDSSISQGIKLLCVAGTVIICASWAGATLQRFSESVFAAVFQ